jgi:hypothetical protein
MAEHEPLNIADKDNERAEKPEARAARREGTTRSGLDTSRAGSADVRSDDAVIGSEPMDLQRLTQPGGQVPPGRQRTGDPPAPRRPPGEAG